MSNEDLDARTRELTDGGYPLTRRARRFRLTVTGGAQAGQRLEGGAAAFQIGSKEGNTLQLTSETVSRYHLEIAPTETGFLLRDLDSTNGTFVDGYRVREIYLPPRATLRVGEAALLFEVLADELEVPLAATPRFGDALGRSPAMREVFQLLEKAAPHDLTILLEGESGTGKERLAEAIHQRSARAKQPLVVFDCAAVPASLIESELFGHERGAFTGAETRRAGHFEEAHGGTIFLDEIGELPLELQPKLLRVLENREVRRVGASQTRSIDVRVIAATNRDLAREVNRGAFREDLFYRLAVVRVRVPPLRERREDVPLLVEHFVREFFDGDEPAALAALSRVARSSWDALAGRPWPGNVRELRNFIERTLALSGGLADTDGEPSVTSPPPSAEATLLERSATFNLARPFYEVRDELLAGFERTYLESVMARNGGNIARASRAAGVDRMYFKRLLRKRLPTTGDR